MSNLAAMFYVSYLTLQVVLCKTPMALVSSQRLLLDCNTSSATVM